MSLKGKFCHEMVSWFGKHNLCAKIIFFLWTKPFLQNSFAIFFTLGYFTPGLFTPASFFTPMVGFILEIGHPIRHITIINLTCQYRPIVVLDPVKAW
jgi:hypothetical protein